MHRRSIKRSPSTAQVEVARGAAAATTETLEQIQLSNHCRLASSSSLR